MTARPALARVVLSSADVHEKTIIVTTALAIQHDIGPSEIMRSRMREGYARSA